jgi:DNA-3-methyladenine glycosylase I
MAVTSVSKGADGVTRCAWASAEPETSYHDAEWGFPVLDDKQLFEQLTLESFQSGLSWRTILVKRENFRSAFKKFNFRVVAKFDDGDVERLLADAGIVRHRGKIEAAINNAQRATEMVRDEGSLGAFFWRYEAADGEAAAALIAKELKRRGWKFVGPTTVYAFMQSVGLVNDHASKCAIHGPVELAREQFVRPTAS